MMGVPVRIFRPKEASDDKLPGVIYFHGGGWCWEVWGKNFNKPLINVFILLNATTDLVYHDQLKWVLCQPSVAK